METTRIFMDAEKAEELHKKYLTHRHYESDMDAEIRRAYKLLSQGKLIIQARASLLSAGLGADTLPKLALANASAPACWLQPSSHTGSATFASCERPSSRGEVNTFRFDRGSFPGIAATQSHRWTFKATMPIIPISDRPRRGLENYHVLWEAEWEAIPPTDPYLLRRIGKSDMWLVCAMWDLTEVEKAVLGSRIGRAN